MQKFIIKGGNPLKGEVSIGGSKNAALPLMAATLLSKEVSILKNVPDIADTRTMLELMQFLGANVSMHKNMVTVDTSKLQNRTLPKETVSKFRSSILLLGPLLARFGEVNMAFPGGCVLGRRSVRAHLYALRDLGAELVNIDNYLHLKAKKLSANDFAMWEASVTATENALLAAAATDGTSTIRLAAMEPHIQDLCLFLKKMGVKIKGIGTATLIVKGNSRLKGVKHNVTSDYLEGGTLAISAALSHGSQVTLNNLTTNHLDSFWNKLRETGTKVELKPNSATITANKKLKSISKVDTRLYPYFPTDLLPPFTVLLTQANGVSKIFETLFEGRMNFLFELEKMRAKVEILNPHQAIIIGPTKLKGTAVTSCDIRAGAAVVLASLIAKGTTEVSNIDYIDRGHERIEDKLKSLGADITRVSE